MIPKWSQDDPKMIPNRPQKDLKIIKKGPHSDPKMLQIWSTYYTTIRHYKIFLYSFILFVQLNLEESSFAFFPSDTYFLSSIIEFSEE